MWVIFLVISVGAIGFLIFTNWWMPRFVDPPIACSEEAKICPDGTAVGRTGADCEFVDCPKVTEQTKVKVYFNNTQFNPNALDCGKVYPLDREIPKTTAVAKASLESLFAGPTEVEKNQGYTSFFSPATKDILKSVKIIGGVAYVDLKDMRQIIPNASASCGSAEFLSEINTTLKQFSTIKQVIVAIEGQPSTFYEWIQIGCSAENNFCDEKPFKGSGYTEVEAKSLIESRSQETILAIKNQDAKRLSELVDSDRGVRFSPYSNVDVKNNLVFSPAMIANFFTDKKVYNWGSFDGSGAPINLTPSDYYNRFIYNVDFVTAPQVSYNRILGEGNIINNQLEVYPNAIIVEYYFPGFDPQYEGMDWTSLRLVFETKAGVWYLVGVVHGQWTI